MYLDASMMHLGNPLTDGQTEPCPLRSVDTGVVGAIKAVKDTALRFGRDPDAVIGDGEAGDALLLRPETGAGC